MVGVVFEVSFCVFELGDLLDPMGVFFAGGCVGVAVVVSGAEEEGCLGVYGFELGGDGLDLLGFCLGVAEFEEVAGDDDELVFGGLFLDPVELGEVHVQVCGEEDFHVRLGCRIALLGIGFKHLS